MEVKEKQVGRPRLYKEEYCNDVVDFGKRGLNFICFASAIGVCRDTIAEWVKVYPEFSVAFKKAKEAQEAWLIQKGAAACNGDTTVNFTAVKFMLAAAHGWRDRDQNITQVIVTGDKKDVSFPSLDELPA